MNGPANKFNNCPMALVEGPCEVCPRHVKKWVHKGMAAKMKHIICNSYSCKMKLNNKLQRERAEKLANKVKP